ERGAVAVGDRPPAWRPLDVAPRLLAGEPREPRAIEQLHLGGAQEHDAEAGEDRRGDEERAEPQEPGRRPPRTASACSGLRPPPVAGKARSSAASPHRPLLLRGEQRRRPRRTIGEHHHAIARGRTHLEPRPGKLREPLRAFQLRHLHLEPLVLAREPLVLGGETGEPVALLGHPRADVDVEERRRGDERAGKRRRGELGEGALLEGPSLLVHESLSTARNRALRDRGFSDASLADAFTALRVRSRNAAVRPQPHTGRSGGQMHPVASRANDCFTIRSSREWKAIAAARPPRETIRGRAARKSESAPSSSFTAMRSAWKVRVAGWMPRGQALRGMAEATVSASFAVSVSAPPRLSERTRRAMGLANRSSPRSRRIPSSSFSSQPASRSASGVPRVESMRMSSGPCLWKEKPRPASSSCALETPRSTRAPSTSGMPRRASTAAASRKLACSATKRSPYLARRVL